MFSHIRRNKIEKKFKKIVKEYEGYIEPTRINEMNLYYDLYPSVQSSVISTNHLEIQFKTDEMSIPISYGILKINDGTEVSLDKGLLYIKGNLEVTVEYNSMNNKKLLYESEKTIVEKALGKKNLSEGKDPSENASSPLYVMSVDYFLRKAAEYFKPVEITDENNRYIETINVWPYVFKEYLDDYKHFLYRLARGNTQVRIKKYVQNYGFDFSYQMSKKEVELIRVLNDITTHRPSITILRTDKILKDHEFNELPFYYVAKPSTLDPNKPPITIDGDFKVKFEPKVKNKCLDLSTNKELKDGMLYLYPDKDFSIPSIPIPVKIFNPGPKTGLLPEKTAKRHVACPPSLLIPEPDVYTTKDKRNEFCLSPVKFIEINKINQYNVDIRETTEHHYRDITKKTVLSPSKFIGYTLLVDWPLDFFLFNCALALPAYGMRTASDGFKQLILPLFDLNNLTSYRGGTISNPLLAALTVWNFASIGFGLYRTYSSFRQDNYFNMYKNKKELIHRGDGLMQLKVGCMDISTKIETVKKSIEHIKKPTDEDKPSESEDVKKFVEGRWLKKV